MRLAFTLIETLAVTALAAVLMLALLAVISAQDKTLRMMSARRGTPDTHRAVLDLLRLDLSHAKTVIAEGIANSDIRHPSLSSHPPSTWGSATEPPGIAREPGMGPSRASGVSGVVLEVRSGLDRRTLTPKHRPARVTYRIEHPGEQRWLVRDQEDLLDLTTHHRWSMLLTPVDADSLDGVLSLTAIKTEPVGEGVHGTLHAASSPRTPTAYRVTLRLDGLTRTSTILP